MVKENVQTNTIRDPSHQVRLETKKCIFGCHSWGPPLKSKRIIGKDTNEWPWRRCGRPEMARFRASARIK